MKTGFRVFLTFSFTGAVVFFAAFVSAAFGLYWEARTTVAVVQSLARSRGTELGIALATSASEQLQKDRNLVAMSATLSEIVKVTKALNNDFQVEEAFILDSNNRLRAHNDVTKLAKDADSPEYSKNEYKQILNMVKRNPVFDRTLSSTTGFDPPYDMIVQKILPGLADNRIHIGVAIFPVDADFPSAGLHLIVSVRSMQGILAGLTESAMWTVAVVSGLTFLCTLVLTFILYFIAIRPAKRAVSMQKNMHHPVALPSGVEFLEATARPMGAHSPSERGGRVMDAIPLDPH